MDVPYEVLSYAVVAVLAAGFTYLFSVRTTRKGKLYDAKMKAYGEVVGLFQEVLIGLDNLSKLQEVNASDTEAFMPNLINLTSELSGLGDSETLNAFVDPERLAKTIKQKGEAQFIENLRSRASILNSRSIADNMKGVRFRAGQLALVKPSDSVKEGLNRVSATIASGGQTIFLQAIDKYPGFSDEIEMPPNLREGALTPEKWREQVGEAIGSLVKAMISDLEKTL